MGRWSDGLKYDIMINDEKEMGVLLAVYNMQWLPVAVAIGGLLHQCCCHHSKSAQFKTIHIHVPGTYH